MIKRGGNSSFLPMLQWANETVEHPFRDCEWTKDSWLLSLSGLKVKDQVAILLSQWCGNLLRCLPNDGVVLFVSLAYGIWISCSKLCFEHKDIPLEIVMSTTILSIQSNKEAYLSKQVMISKPQLCNE